MSNYAVIYETAEDGSVSAYVPELPISLVSGRDRAEAKTAVLEGIKLYREELERTGASSSERSLRREVLSV